MAARAAASTSPRPGGAAHLVCAAGDRLLALPLDRVLETMRPLPVAPMTGAPAFVLGLSIVRGAPTPVVDGARLLGTPGTSPARLVTLRTGGRVVALAVDAVQGIRFLAPEALHDLPPLLRDLRPDLVSAIGLLDSELLLVLRDARLVPHDAPAAPEDA